MKNKLMFGFLLSITFAACHVPKKKKHLFFLHNRFLEEHHIDEEHAEYGRVEYREIISAFSQSGFRVYHEQRKGNVNAHTYANQISIQIDSLLKQGVVPSDITIVGTSKGGYIAQYVSTIMNNENLNFVFVACFQSTDIERIPEINFCGNILTIYERSDSFGVSAQERQRTSSCTINRFKEIELNTGLGHGFLFKPLDEWIRPTILWAYGEGS